MKVVEKVELTLDEWEFICQEMAELRRRREQDKVQLEISFTEVLAVTAGRC